MFSMKIIDTDMFLDMPMTARLLYYDLSMRADDDGFVASPKKIQRMIGCSDDDLKLLTAKQFVIPFESGICVIKHWKIHNYIQTDRYNETLYKDEKNMLQETNGTYELNDMDTKCIQNVSSSDTQVRLGKDRDRLGKDRLEIELEDKPKKIKYADRVSMLEEEYLKLINQYSKDIIDNKIIDLDLWKGSKGKSTKSDYLTLLSWLRKDAPKASNTNNKNVQAGLDLIKKYENEGEVIDSVW